jgi:hypothetical protein
VAGIGFHIEDPVRTRRADELERQVPSGQEASTGSSAWQPGSKRR